MNFTDFKIAYRNLLKNKIESLISILGLGIGLGCIMILGVLFLHEYSFDKFIPEYKTAFRVQEGPRLQMPFLLAPSIKSEIPEIEDYFRYYQAGRAELKNSQNRIVSENLFAFADENMFERLGMKLKYGKAAATVSEVAISESMAQKYFNADHALGSPLLVKLKDNFLTLTVCGIYRDFPGNSSLHPEFVANIKLTQEVLGFSRQVMLGDYASVENDLDNWDKSDFYTYVFLNPKADPKVVGEKIKNFMLAKDAEKYAESDYKLQAVEDTYLHSADLVDLYCRQGNSTELKYYAGIALIILVIAIVNYVFLTKAGIMSRLTEIGTKKAVGAGNGTIRKQVLLESNITSLLSIVPAIVIIIAGVPFVNSTLGKTVGSEVIGMWQTWGLLFAVVLLTGTISGLLIGTSISRTSAIKLLSGQLKIRRKKYNLNHSFLSFHFAIFMVLVVSILTFKKQINFGLSNFTAINPHNIMVCELNSPELQKQIKVLQNELEKDPNVIMTAGSSFIPPFNNFLPIKLQTGDESIRFDGLIMGQGMIELLGMEIIDGESFGEYDPENRVNFVLNESAALKYNIKAGDQLNGANIRGIVKDFSAHSIHSLIQPMAILQQNPEKMRLLAIKTNGLNDNAIKTRLENLMAEISPESIPEIKYLTDQIGQFYSREQNQAKLITAFSLLAVSLAVMGLFGIVLITISRRTKEIGIRKVNGARATEVVEMLNKDFLKWVLVAFAIATPVSYYVMNKWLGNFAYKTSLSWWIFMFAGILALGIAMLTVSFQSWRAATRNPVEALRYE
ncbi:MAG TPA: ABC transporter permease [Draconibacterium sp.]|nr:ABC transporter permease [Draconibacterium sp.]